MSGKKIDKNLQKILRIKEENVSILRKYPNVTGIGVGYKVVNGKRTERICIRVYVSKKIPLNKLKQKEILPTEIDGIPTDIIEVTFAMLNNDNPIEDEHEKIQGKHKKKHNPLIGGISIGTVKPGKKAHSTGTLGISVYDNITYEDMILSNWHVLCRSPTVDCSTDESIIQPGVSEFRDVKEIELERELTIEEIEDLKEELEEPYKVAKIYRWILNNNVDAAIARLTGHRFLLKKVLELGKINSIGIATLGMHVRKSGRTTEVTSGYVTDIDYEGDIYGYPEGYGNFKKQIMIENSYVADGGDSGSVWIDDSNNVIGLNFAGPIDGTDMALANQIQLVLEALNINFNHGITQQAFIANMNSLLF